MTKECKKYKSIIEMTQPEWMQKIPSSTVCNFFYGWFVVYAVLFSLSVVVLIGTFVFSKKLGPAGIGLGVQSIITSLLAASFMMFHYIICDRALLPLTKE